MVIDSVNIKVSWNNVMEFAKSFISDIPVTDFDIRYDKEIIISGSYRLKIDIPFSITVDNISCTDGSIVFHLNNLHVYAIPVGVFKDILIKAILRKSDTGIMYGNDELMIPVRLIEDLLKIDGINLVSIRPDSEFIEVQAENIVLHNR